MFSKVVSESGQKSSGSATLELSICEDALKGQSHEKVCEIMT
jgi:hypothetical protein